ncbi:MAG: LamG-like jellyroll fold domain-containing protein, partial [Pseudomonadota bacterium]
MTNFFGDDYVTQSTDLVFDPSGGQFGPDVTGFVYEDFFGIGEDDLVGDTFSVGGPVIFNIPFQGDTEIFRARLFGEIGVQFGLQITSTLDPGSVDAILPYETVVGYPDFDIATIAAGDVVDLFFGATLDPGADPNSGFTTAFPRFTFDLGILTELVVDLAAEVGALGNNEIIDILDFTVPETVLPIISVDTGRTITQEQADEDLEDTNEVGDANPIQIFGAITTQDLVNEIPGLDPAFNDAGEFAGIGIPLNTFVSGPKADKAETTDASPEGENPPQDSGPGFDLTSIDLGKFEIFVPNINTVSEFNGEIFVTDPTREAEYTFETDPNGARILDENGRPIILSIDRVEDLDAEGNNLGEGNRDDLVRLTLDLDGLITYASGGTFPPLELDIDLIDGSVAGVNLDAGFSYNLFDVELEAALPLEQEFTLTPKLLTGLRFFETNPDGSKGDAKAVEVLTQRKVLRFDETGIFQDEALTERLRELAEGNATFAQDIDLFLDLDQGIAGAFTGQTASIGGRMIISRDGGVTWDELFTGASDPIAESEPELGQDQTAELELAEGTLLGYRLFIGSGSAEVQEDYVIDFDPTDSVYVEQIEDTSTLISETPFLEDLNTLNIVYDDAETFVEIVSQSVPIVTNRTGLEFDLALILRGLAASAFFNASIDIGPFTVGTGLDFEIGPLFEEKFELLNLDIVDLFNDSFQIQDTETTSFVLGAPAPESDLGDAIVGTAGNDTILGTPGDDEIIAFEGEDSVDAGAGNDTIFLGNSADSVDGGEGFDTLDLSDLQRQIATVDVGSFFGDMTITRVLTGQQVGMFLAGLDRDGATVLPRGDVALFISEDAGAAVRFPEHTAVNIERVIFTDLGDDVFITNDQGIEVYETGEGNDGIKFDLTSTLPINPVTILAGAGNDVVSTVFAPLAAGTSIDGGEGYDYLEVDGDLDLENGLGADGETYTGFEALATHQSSSASNTFRGNDAGNSLFGGGGNDTLEGRGGNDALYGDADDDVLIGGAGADGLFGGAGLDTADYSGAGTSVFVDLDFAGVGRGFRGDAQGDVLDSVEDVRGSDFEDILIGDNASNTLAGGLGDDRLQSQGGSDLLLGGADNDLLNRGTKASLGGSFANTFDGGEGFDVLAIDVFDKFRQTGKYTVDDGGRFTFREGIFTNPDKVAFRDIEIDFRYDRSAHVEVVLDETGSGSIKYVEDDASSRFLATRIEGQAVYSSRNNLVDPTWDKRTSDYDINISDQSLSALRGDNINFPRGDFFDLFGTGTVNSTTGVPDVSGGEFGSEEFSNIEGVIGSDGDDAIIGNAADNALFGNGGWDIILGGGGNDRLGFGEAQSLSDAFSFPSGSGGQTSVQFFQEFEERLQFLDPDEVGGEIIRARDQGEGVIKSLVRGTNSFVPGSSASNGIAPFAKINEGNSTSAEIFTVGSFLWGGAGVDTLDMRFDRGITFFPDLSTNFARVDLNVAGGNAPDNVFTGEQLQYGFAEWFNAAGTRQSFAHTFGVENVIGSRMGDTITGDRGDNTIEGLDGADVLDGDEGFDTASYALAEEGVTLNIRADGDGFAMDNARATITGTGGATGDIATGFEGFVASDHDDIAIVEGGALASDNTILVDFTDPFGGTGQQEVTFGVLDPDNLLRGLALDLGTGNDALTLEGLGAHDVLLGDGDDTATIRNIGHSIDAGAGNDVITVLDHEDQSLADVDEAARVTTIDGGAGDDVVVFTGPDYVLLEVTDEGAIVTERLNVDFSPLVVEIPGPEGTDSQFVFLDSDPEVQAAIEAAANAVARYELSNVEIVEINGERIRIDNPDPIVDSDVTLTVNEDQIDAYDMDLLITQDDIDAGETFIVISPPLTADLVVPGGQPIVMGETLTAADMAALQVVPGQNFDPASDMFSYIRTGDPEDEARTATLPEPVRGVSLNITSHLEEIERVILPPEDPTTEIALVRLNPATGTTLTDDEVQYADGGIFSDMPSGSMTIEFLFRSAGDFDPNGPDFSFLSYAAGGNNNELTMFGTKEGRGLALGFNGVGTDTGYRIDQLFDRELHRISVTYDTAANRIEMFVDGISVFENSTATLGSIANNGYLVWGQEQDAFGGSFDPNQIVKGDMGDIRIWDSVRSNAEIADNAFNELADPSAEASLAAYWQADPTNEGVMINQVGDTHLALVNAPEIVTVDEPTPPNVEVIPTVRVNIGTITDDYIEIDNTPMPTADMTMEFVMQGLDLPEEFSQRQHFASYAVPGSNNEFLMFVDGTNLAGNIGFGVSGNSGFDTGLPSSLLFDGEPHRVSITLDVSEQVFTFYIDGVEVFTGDGNGPLNLQTGGTFNFGQEQDSVGGNFDPNQIVRADFGDIRLWNDVRTPEEIASNAFSQIVDPGAEQGLVANWQVDPNNNTTIPDLVGGAPMRQEATPVRGSVQFDLPPEPEIIGPPIVVEVETLVVDQQGDPVTIVVDEVPTDGVVFYMAPDPVMLAVGFTFLVETPVAVGDELTPDQLEGLFFRADKNFTGDPGAFRYTVRDDVSFRDLASTEEADQNNATNGDLRDGAASQTISFDVVPANDAPEISNVLFPISPGAELRNAVRTADAEGDAFEVTLLEGPSLGSIVLNPDGTFTYTQDAALDFGGAEFLEDRFTVRATETTPSNGNVQGDPAQSAPQEQLIRILNPALQSEIVFDPNDPDFFDEDGNPIRIGGLETNDVIRGHDGPDGLFGFGGDDTILGDEGDDLVDGGLGDDSADGGGGIDTLSYATLTTPGFAFQGSVFGVFVSLEDQGTPQVTGAGLDIFNGFENLEGSPFADLLTGDGAANTLSGLDGADVINGGGGDDLILGGSGFDAVEGGPGADQLFGGTGGNVIEGDIVTY